MYCINIHIILLGHKTLVCYLYLISLWEIQYLWCCAIVLTGVSISGRSCKQLFIKKVFLWSVLFDISSVSIIVIAGKTQTFSLFGSVCHSLLAACLKNISHLNTFLMSQLSHRHALTLLVMPNSTRKINQLVCCVPLAKNLERERDLELGVVQEAPHVA